jgi:excisionase family DNA binding protein
LNPTSTSDWFTAAEAAEYLRFNSKKALYQAVRRGQVPAHRLGLRQLRFSRVELDRLLLGGSRTFHAGDRI